MEWIIYNEKNNFKFEIKDGNGKFKEYDYKGNLIFEGELINGEKKGKQYDYKGNLLFEGEYLNGIEWNGKIKKYERIEPCRFRCGYGCGHGFNMFDYEDEDNSEICNEKIKYIIKYEGEYLNGKRNGKGKEFDINGKLIYDGKYLNGEKVKQKNNINDYYEEYILIFEGELLNGKIHGKVKEYGFNGKIKFEGEYLEGKKISGKEYNERGEIKSEINRTV